MKKTLISLFLILSLLCGITAPAMAAPATGTGNTTINTTQKTLRLWYDEEAPYGNENQEFYRYSALKDNDGWMRWSIPLGNGYMGANVFGRTETERIQISEATLFNEYKSDVTEGGVVSGLNSFAETYIDFQHKQEDVSNYTRDLTLNTALSSVQYDYNGVTYNREYFTSYPDKVMVMRFTASEDAKVSFTLRPEIPWLQEYPMNSTEYPMAKTGTVTAEGDTITLKGNMEYYNINFEGRYKVIPEGGSMTASNNNGNGTITVTDADSVVILLAVGTNYKLESKVFTESNREKKLDGDLDPHEKVSGIMEAAVSKTYTELYDAHEADYTNLFNRVCFDLGATVPTVTTDVLLSNYQNGNYDKYLEELYFQYGRYLLIASSRDGGMPAHLQGIWNQYNGPYCSSGYWHNINVQMNYWPAFSTNLAETFEAYRHYFEAYYPAANKNAATYIKRYHSDKYTTDADSGWVIGTGCSPYVVGGIGGSSTIGNAGFTSKLFWDYYDFTRDDSVLKEFAYPAIAGMTDASSKILTEVDGKLLTAHSASPEQYKNGDYYYTQGTAYDQQMVWENHKQTIDGAAALGKSDTSSQIAEEQLDKLDPVLIGYSGQVKEFREEDYYGDIGEYNHRHISQLVGLYPGTSINSTTPAWLDAAKVTLTERGDNATGWGVAHRLNLWARTKDGDRTYQLYQQLLKKNTMQNLWDSHPPFQIDGNFGGTAGVAEMLLQSHEGYLAPLAALPTAWGSGSYSGLVARGNFEVSANWKNNTAERFEILSKVGGECIVTYGTIHDATVTTTDGETVSFTKSTAEDGSPLVTFDTVKGETYVITGFSPIEKVAAPSQVQAKLTDGSTAKITWASSSDATSYNLYKAVNNDSNYTLIASSVTDTSYDYAIPEADRNQRTTYRVTAVSASGKESNGVLAYINPQALALTDAFAEYLDGGAVQFTASTAEDATAYRLYSYDDASETYTLVQESAYPVIITDSYDATKRYALSAASDQYEGEKMFAVWSEAQDTSNILKGKTPSKVLDVTTGLSISERSGYPFSNITDSNLGTRHVVDDSKTNYSMEYDLEGTYTLNKLTVYDFEDTAHSRSDKTSVEVYNNDTWTTVIDKQPLNFVSGKHKGGSDTTCTTFHLNGAKGSRIRVTFCNTSGESKSASIWEMTLSAKSDAEYTEKTDSNLFLNKSATVDKTFSSSYPISNALDGNLGTRWSVNGNPYTVTIDLGGTQILKTMKIFEFADGNSKINGVLTTRSPETTVELYTDGEWVTKIDKQPLQTPKEDTSAGDANTYTAFDLGFTPASRVRITFHNTNNSNPASIWEIQCSGALLKGVNKQPLLDAMDKLDAVDTATLDSVAQTALDDAKTSLMEKLTCMTLTEGSVATAVTAAENLLSLIQSGDTDALLPETDLYTGTETLTLGGDDPTAMTLECNVSGVGGKLATDKVYKEYGVSRSSNPANCNIGIYYPFKQSTQYAIMEYNFMLSDRDSKLWGAVGGFTDTEGNGQTELRYEISKDNGFVVTTNNTVVSTDIQPNRWYKVAIVIPYSADGTASTMQFYLNGQETVVNTSKSFYAPRHFRVGIAKDETRTQTVYFDNVIFKRGSEHTYNKNRDKCNDLTLTPNDNITLTNNLFRMESSVSVNTLAALLSNSDWRIYSDSTCTTELKGDEMIPNHAVLVAYASNLRDYERTYHYYNIQSGLNLEMATYEVGTDTVSGIKINTPSSIIKGDVLNSGATVSITRNGSEVIGSVASGDVLTLSKNGESVSYTLSVDGYVIDEDFSDYTDGNPPKTFTGGVIFTGKLPDGVTLSNTNEDGAFKLSASGVTEYMAGDYYLHHNTLNLKSYGIVEFKIKPTEKTVPKTVTVKGVRSDSSQIGWDSGNFSFDSNGYINFGYANIMPYEENTWYDIKLIYDFANARKMLYVDGILKYVGDTKLTSLTYLTFGASRISTGFSVYYDDIKVYDAYPENPFDPCGLTFDGSSAMIYADRAITGSLVFASYCDERLVDVELHPITTEIGKNTVTPTALPQDADTVKVMFWDNATLTPLCSAVEKKLK